MIDFLSFKTLSNRMTVQWLHVPEFLTVQRGSTCPPLILSINCANWLL